MLDYEITIKMRVGWEVCVYVCVWFSVWIGFPKVRFKQIWIDIPFQNLGEVLFRFGVKLNFWNTEVLCEMELLFLSQLYNI